MPTEPIKLDPPRRERRWFQFRLRTLLIGVTAWSVLLIQWPLVEWELEPPSQADCPNLMLNERQKLPEDLWIRSYYVPLRVWQFATAEIVVIAGWQLLALLRRASIEQPPVSTHL